MRDPAVIDRTANALDVERLACFQPSNGVTHCNSYVHVFMACLGAAFAPPGYLANQQHDWLATASNGWRRVDLPTAALNANLGKAVVASWKNDDGHGHIGVVMPGSGTRGLLVSAAGRHNFRRAPIERSFGLLKPDYFVCEKEM